MANYKSHYESSTAPIRRIKITYTDYREVTEGEEIMPQAAMLQILQHYKDQGVVGATITLHVPGDADLTYEVAE